MRLQILRLGSSRALSAIFTGARMVMRISVIGYLIDVEMRAVEVEAGA